MRHLMLLRHAKSSWDDPALSDHARPLNARGRRAAAAMARALREDGLRPDLVLVSSARRTLQTLEALGLAPGPQVEPTDELYLAPWTTMLEVVNRAPDSAGTVLLIGHNPGLHDLALNLLPVESLDAPPGDRLGTGYPTGMLAEFTVEGPWSALRAGSARLRRLLAPDDLPEMAQ